MFGATASTISFKRTDTEICFTTYTGTTQLFVALYCLHVPGVLLWGLDVSVFP